MAGILFEWDEAKNLTNQRKHGVSFQEASQVFWDPLHVIVADRVVDGEQRWQTLGMVRRAGGSLLVLLVAHTVREDPTHGTLFEVVRIISARRATPEERNGYEDDNG